MIIVGQLIAVVIGLLIVIAMNIYWDKQWEKRTGRKLPPFRDRFRRK